MNWLKYELGIFQHRPLVPVHVENRDEDKRCEKEKFHRHHLALIVFRFCAPL